MPRKKAPCRDTAAAPAQTDAASLQESHTCSPGVSEQCSLPGMGDDGSASSSSKKPRGRGRTPREQALAPVVASARGRGKPVNTTHVFKTTASPCSDEDFSALSKGRATTSRQNTSIKHQACSPAKHRRVDRTCSCASPCRADDKGGSCCKCAREACATVHCACSDSNTRSYA